MTVEAKTKRSMPAAARSVPVHVGTSGWVYGHWKGIFYPEGLRATEELAFYSRHFDTVEVNFSFYRLPAKAVFESWRERSPQGFTFAVKASRYLTHMKKLKDPEEPLALFMEHASGLGRKLGPILFQFPRTWPAHIERLEGFLDALRAYPRRRFTFEFRHESWLVPAVYRLLESAGAALCLPVGPGVPLDPRTTAPWTYIRMHAGKHATAYTDAEIDEWAKRIRAFRRKAIEVYIYFNNDPDGHAIRDARRLEELLG